MGEREEVFGVGLKLVQELAESGQGPPDRYIQREENRPIGGPPLTSPVPVIDLHRLFQPDGDDEADKLRSALQSWGLFQTRKVADRILWAITKLLELDESYFINQLGDRARVSARFTCYPCCSRPDLVFSIKPHSDNSVITIILPDKVVEGLQVLKDGEWVNVPSIPHALLINMGDQMEIMSNGNFKSPVHRVVANHEERISVAVFYGLELSKDLEPAEGLVDEGRPRLFKKMKTKDYHDVFFRNFSRGKRTIDWAKI